MIALITPTGARRAQFNLCMQWMRRQTYTGRVVWLIVDDADPVTTDAVDENFKPDWTIIKVHPIPVWEPGQNTQSRNLITGLYVLRDNYPNIKAIFFIEDDDYYRPQYLQRMMDHFDGVKVLGELNTVYYNVVYRTYFINRNTSHSSLFQVAIRPEMIELFQSIIYDKFIDFKFYQRLHAEGFVSRGEVGFFNENNLAIGMKGMPGRAGIGAGHGRLMNMLPDANMIYLRNQIGEDAKYFEGYYGGGGQQQYPGLNDKRH